MDGVVPARLRIAWAEALDVDEDEVQMDSNFIELGGDSVLGIKLGEIAPRHGIDLSMETIFREATFSGMLASTTVLHQQDKPPETPAPATIDPQLLQTCAEACGLPTDKIEDVFPATFWPAFLFSTHGSEGAWLMQLTFELKGSLQPSLACKALETIHNRYPAFRSRFTTLNDKVQTIITKTPVVWKHSNDLAKYRSEDRAIRVTSGQPAARYALVTESNTTYIVWTALHSIMDGWTRKILCDDLEAFFRDPSATSTLPPRPSVHLYVTHIDNLPPSRKETSAQFWTDYIASMPPPPALVPATAHFPNPLCNQNLTIHVPLSHVPISATNPSIRLSSIAHAAMSLVLSSITRSPDTFFYGVRASRTFFPSAEAIPGPLYNAIPYRAHLDRKLPVAAFLAKVHEESLDMMPHEPFALGALQRLFAMEGAVHSLTFNWHPKGTDLFARRILVPRSTSSSLPASEKQGDGEEGELSVVEEKYSPHHSAGVWNVYDNGDSLRLSLEYDERVLDSAWTEMAAGRFVDVLKKLRRCGGGGSGSGSGEMGMTVGDVLDAYA